MTLYAGWHPVGETTFTVRHIIEGELEPFYGETGKGGFGDTVFVRSLEPEDQEYPADLKLVSGFESQKITLKKEPDSNVFTVTYRKTDEVTGEGEEGEEDEEAGVGKEDESDDVTEGTPDDGSGGANEKEPDEETENVADEAEEQERHEITSSSGKEYEEKEREKETVSATGDSGSTVGILMLAVMAAALGLWSGRRICVNEKK